MDILILLALALAPGVAIGVYIYLKDHHEREPVGLLIRSFFFGVLSIFVTLLISQVIGLFVTIDETSVSDQAVSAFLIVALVEEFSKFIFVRGILYNNKHFNEPFDGIVYSVMVGMGFATFENILYVVDGGIGTALLRMLTAVPAHATFAVLMGYYLGKAKFEHKKILLRASCSRCSHAVSWRLRLLFIYLFRSRYSVWSLGFADRWYLALKKSDSNSSIGIAIYSQTDA
jgi:RsiW-degrading membrane proteinase PrsW (M82 family)